MHTFSCAFGDADGDGDLDLAVACGELYREVTDQSRVYYNEGGTLEDRPRWKHRAESYALDISWADFDRDGRLDLSAVYYFNPNRIFRNEGDSIRTVTWWFATDGGMLANSMAICDFGRDGYPDLFVTNNGQLGGTGRLKMYRNFEGAVDRNPTWVSEPIDEGSGIALFDIDDDGDYDIVTGAWFSPVFIFVNDNGKFRQEPDWTSGTSSVIEAIVPGDVDNDGLRPESWEFELNEQGRNLFSIPRIPIHRLVSVEKNGTPLPLSDYCWSADQGWVSVAGKHTSGAIRVNTIVSDDLDFAVTNWDATKGNYLFINSVTVDVKAKHRQRNHALAIRPNPAVHTASLAYILDGPGTVAISVVDMTGRRCYSTTQQHNTAGEFRYTLPLKSLKSGTYVLSLEQSGTRSAHLFTVKR